jgi:hypothetical protein
MAQWIAENVGEAPTIDRVEHLDREYGGFVSTSNGYVSVNFDAEFTPQDARFVAALILRAARRAEEP